MSSFLVFKRLRTAFIEPASPEHNLIGIADVIDRCDLTTRQLFTVLVRKHLQFEFHTVDAPLGTKPVYAVQTLVANPGQNLLLGQSPLPSQELRSPFTSQEAFDNLQLELWLVLVHVTP